MTTLTKFHPSRAWAMKGAAVTLAGVGVLAFAAMDARFDPAQVARVEQPAAPGAGTGQSARESWREERESWGPLRLTDW